MRVRLVSALLACAVLSAVAAPAVAEDSKAAAKAEFERGLALSKQKRHVEALKAFLHSRELFPTRTNTQNAALMLKLLGRYDESIAMLEEMLRQFPDLTQKQRRAVQQELDELAGEVGTIAVTTPMPGASVEIDGERRGTLPLEAPVRVNPGRHRVNVRGADGTTAEAFVSVAARESVYVDPVASAPKPQPPAPQPNPEERKVERENPEPTRERASSFYPIGWLEAGGAVDTHPPHGQTTSAYGFIGPGVELSTGFGVRADGTVLAAYGSVGTYALRDCEPSDAYRYQKVLCSSRTWAAGVELGQVSSWDAFELELGLRAAYFSLEVERDFEIDKTVTYAEKGFRFQFLVVPEYVIARHFALGTALGWDTQAMAHFGLRAEVRF